MSKNKTVAVTVYKLWLGQSALGKSYGFSKDSFIFGEVCAETRHSSYTKTLCTSKEQQLENRNSKQQMKVLIVIAAILSSFNTYSQRRISETIKFQDSILTYELITYAKPIISDFYVVINENSEINSNLIKSLKDCYKLNTDFYFLDIDAKKYSKSEKEKLLIVLIKQLKAKRKLENSKLHFVLNSNYSELYNTEQAENNLNEISELKIMTLENSICELIRGF
ncbi:MAG: hypothetical protein R2797_08745 [Gelidibacter sp.]